LSFKKTKNSTYASVLGIVLFCWFECVFVLFCLCNSDCREKRAKPHATDPQLAERLWTISAEMCNLSTTTSTH